jgi:hypothetical protein
MEPAPNTKAETPIRSEFLMPTAMTFARAGNVALTLEAPAYPNISQMRQESPRTRRRMSEIKAM